MVIFTKVSGKTVKPPEKVFLSINKDLCMRVNGKMINITEKELSNGTTTKSFTLETSSMDKRQAKVNLSLTVTFMKAISLTASSTEKVSTTFPSPAKSTRVDSRRTTCTAEAR